MNLMQWQSLWLQQKLMNSFRNPKKGWKEFTFTGLKDFHLTFTGICHMKQSFFLIFEVYLNQHNLCYIYPTDKPWNDNII